MPAVCVEHSPTFSMYFAILTHTVGECSKTPETTFQPETPQLAWDCLAYPACQPARSRGAGDRLLERRGAVLVKRSVVCPSPAPPHPPGSNRRGQSAWKISIYLARPARSLLALLVLNLMPTLVVVVLLLPLLA